MKKNFKNNWWLKWNKIWRD